MGGAEGDDGFIREVGLLDEGIDWPGGEAPPDWVANEDGVVGVPIGDGYVFEGDVLERGIVVFFGNAGVGVGPVEVCFGVGCGRFDFEEIGVEIGRDFGCDVSGVVLS